MGDVAEPDVHAAVARAFHDEWGRVVATLIRVTGDWDVAEECAQDAFTIALDRWARDGVPRNPGAWLTTTARHRAIDRARRAARGDAKLQEVAVLTGEEAFDDSGIPDDRLRLMFTCCHPALSEDAQVVLTLRTLAGLTTAEIARAFLVPEVTMRQRLTRAKRKIEHAGIPYRVPPAHLLPERTQSVLAVLYLLFNSGYSDPSRPDLSAEAIHLTRMLVTLMPDEPEAIGLLALLRFHDGRRAARVDADGAIVTLEDQDRSRWDRVAIAEGAALLDRALRRDSVGPYQVQAAIAAAHALAPSADATDWPRIAALYDELLRWMPTPVVALNRAVAVAMADGPDAGLALLADLDLPAYHLLPATRADLLRRLGRADEAAAAYRDALALAPTEAERRYLARRLASVT